MLTVVLAVALGFPSSLGPWPWSPAARSHFDEGRKLQDQALYPYAINQLQLSLSAEPHAEAERALGECFAAMSQPLLASLHFARYVSAAPRDAEILNRLGSLQLELKQPEEAGRTFRALETLDAESAHTGLMQVELKLGEREYAARKYEAALRHYSAALELGHGDPRASDGIARCHLQMQR